MKLFLKHKTEKKIKIMMFIFLLVNLFLLGLIIKDFINYRINILYIFFVFLGLSISLLFRKDKTIKWNNETQKVIKNTEISTIVLIILIVLTRKFVLPDIFSEFHLAHITTITLIITFGFFSGKLYFIWDKLKDIFCEVCENNLKN